MKVSQAIEQLKGLLEKHGDLDLVNLYEYQDSLMIQHGCDFDIVEYGCEECGTQHKVCAVVEPEEEAEEEKPRHLQLVKDTDPNQTVITDLTEAPPAE